MDVCDDDVEDTTVKKLSDAVDALLQSTGAKNGLYIECCTAYHACIGSGLSLTGSTVHRVLMERMKLHLCNMRSQLDDMKDERLLDTFGKETLRFERLLDSLIPLFNYVTRRQTDTTHANLHYELRSLFESIVVDHLANRLQVAMQLVSGEHDSHYSNESVRPQKRHMVDALSQDSPNAKVFKQ